MTRTLQCSCVLLAAAASGTVALTPPPPEFADGESTVCRRLPESRGADEKFNVEISCAAGAAGEFEVWFCKDDDGGAAFCDVCVGIDRGRVFARRGRLDSIVFDPEPVSGGVAKMEIAMLTGSSGASKVLESAVNGARSPAMENALRDAACPAWRSVRVVARNCGAAPAVEASRTQTGLTLRIASATDSRNAW